MSIQKSNTSLRRNNSIKSLHIYPVKSLPGISLDHSLVEEKGLQFDRRWMLIDEENSFITQRTFHQLALLQVKLEGDMIFISTKNADKEGVSLPLKAEKGEILKCNIWQDNIEVLWPNVDADEWFSDFLNAHCRLVYQPDNALRQIDPDYVKKKLNTSLSDGYPILIANQSSLDNLAQRAGVAIEMERFRPNIIVEIGTPYEEDGWKELKAGSAELTVVKPCARCSLTTIDPKTAETGKEPLKTLARYRKQGNKILFGQNVIVEKGGNIQVGDSISVN